MGRKPFSSKAKKQQLRLKRLAASTSPVLATQHSTSSNSQPAPTAVNPSTSSHSPHRARGRAPKGSRSHRYRLNLADSTNSNTRPQRLLAHKPIVPLALPETSVSDVRPYPDARYAMPRRPSWRYDDSVDTLERREKEAFAEWLQQVGLPDQNAAYFEHNLETWRQLWRVIERSDVLILVADARFPALHFVPDLYHYANDELHKGVVLALNKCDLVPVTLLNAWRKHFEQEYPAMAIAMFSSFPDAKLVPSLHNSDTLLSKRERRMARSKLSAWGADQLFEAIDSLKLDAGKKRYLNEWKEKLARDAALDDEDGSHVNYLQSALRRCDEDGKSSNNKRHDQVNKGKTAGNEIGGDGKDANRDQKYAVSQQAKASNGEAMNNEALREEMLTIGIVGHPNAGKSSMINGVFNRKVVSTSRTPGHTKHLQTMFLSEGVRLCDCPGLVFPGIASRELQIVAGMFPVAQVREPYAAIKYLAERVDIVQVLNLDSEVKRLEDFNEEKEYLKDGWTGWKICEAWAMKRGFRTAKAARLDVFRAANHILRLGVEGRIVLATVPTGYKSKTGTERIVDEEHKGLGEKDIAGVVDIESVKVDGAFEKEDEDCESGSDSPSDSESEIESESDEDASNVYSGNAFMVLQEE